MNTSKFQLVFIGVFAAFIIIGVGIFAFGNRGAGTGSSKVTVWGTMPLQTFQTIFSSTALSKNKTFSVTYVEKSKNSFDSDFVNALAEGRGPDLIFISQESLLKNRNKILVIPYKSYSERIFRDTFVEEGLLFTTAEGIIAFPISIDPLVMYWNQDIFINASLSEPPAFWDEFFNLSQLLTTKDGAFNITRSTLALGEYANVTNSKAILSALLLQAGNPIVSLQNGVYISTLRDNFGLAIPPGSAALSFYTEFSNSSKPYYTWNRSLPESQTAFLAGDLAVYFGFASEFPVLKLKNPNLNFDVRVFPQSSNVRTGSRKMTFGLMEGVAIVKNSPNVGGAFTVVLELLGRDTSQALSRALSQSPARRDVLGVAQSDAVLPVFYTSSLISQGWLDPDNNKTDDIFKNMIESVTGGRAKLDAAVTAASLQIGELLKK